MNKTVLTTISFFILIITTSVSCNKSTTCPDPTQQTFILSAGDLSYIPYENGSTIKCLFNEKDTVTAYLDTISYDYYMQTCCNNDPCRVTNEYTYQVKELLFKENQFNDDFLKIKLIKTSGNSINLNFQFYNAPILKDYTIKQLGLGIFLKIDGITYNDILIGSTYGEPPEDSIFYSKRYGLIRVIYRKKLVYKRVL